MSDPALVRCIRPCPWCGKATEYLVVDGARNHVKCPHCNEPFEVSTIKPPRPGSKRRIGSPTWAGGEFDYAPASSHDHPGEFMRRM